MLVTLEFSNRSSISDLNVTSSTGTLHMVDLWKLSQNHISRSKFIGHSLFESPLRSSSLSLHSIAGRSDFVPTTRFFTRPDNCSFSLKEKLPTVYKYSCRKTQGLDPSRLPRDLAGTREPLRDDRWFTAEAYPLYKFPECFWWPRVQVREKRKSNKRFWI